MGRGLGRDQGAVSGWGPREVVEPWKGSKAEAAVQLALSHLHKPSKLLEAVVCIPLSPFGALDRCSQSGGKTQPC